jgi:hypothetical protein
MNEEQLTPSEHAAVRQRLIAGAKRIRPIGKHRNAWIAGSVAVILVLGIAGGSIGIGQLLGSSEPLPAVTTTPTPEPSPSPTKSPSPTTTPVVTADPARTDGVTAFGGACANALDASDVSGAVGVDVVLYEPAWRSGAEALHGGLVCTWTDPNEYSGMVVTLYSYPAGSVPSEITDAPVGCAPNAYTCGVRGSAGATWMQLVVSPSSDPTIPQQLLNQALIRAADYPAPHAAQRSSGWWSLPVCADLIESTKLEAVTGWADLTELVVPEGDSASIQGLPELRNGLRWCIWTGMSRNIPITLSVRIIPGGGAYFDEIAGSVGATVVQVDGARSAVDVKDDALWEGHSSPVVATDGVNTVIVGVNSSDDGDVRGPVAAAVLAAMR